MAEVYGNLVILVMEDVDRVVIHYAALTPWHTLYTDELGMAGCKLKDNLVRKNLENLFIVNKIRLLLWDASYPDPMKLDKSPEVL